MIKFLIITSFTLFQINFFSKNARIETVYNKSDFKYNTQIKDSTECKKSPLFQAFIDSVERKKCFFRLEPGNLNMNPRYYNGNAGIKIKYGCILHISSSCGVGDRLEIQEWLFPSVEEAQKALKYIQTYEWKYKGATYARQGKYPLASMRAGTLIFIFISENGFISKPNPVPQYLDIMKYLSAPKVKKSKAN